MEVVAQKNRSGERLNRPLEWKTREGLLNVELHAYPVDIYESTTVPWRFSYYAKQCLLLSSSAMERGRLGRPGRVLLGNTTVLPGKINPALIGVSLKVDVANEGKYCRCGNCTRPPSKSASVKIDAEKPQRRYLEISFFSPEVSGEYKQRRMRRNV